MLENAGMARQIAVWGPLVSGSYSPKPFFSVGLVFGLDSQGPFLAVTLGRLLSNHVSVYLSKKMGEWYLSPKIAMIACVCLLVSSYLNITVFP